MTSIRKMKPFSPGLTEKELEKNMEREVSLSNKLKKGQITIPEHNKRLGKLNKDFNKKGKKTDRRDFNTMPKFKKFLNRLIQVGLADKKWASYSIEHEGAHFNTAKKLGYKATMGVVLFNVKGIFGNRKAVMPVTKINRTNMTPEDWEKIKNAPNELSEWDKKF